MTDTFYSGGFGVEGPLMEWDGTNHEEILEWLQETIPAAVISSVSPTELVYSWWGGSFMVNFSVSLNDWILRNGNATTTVQKVGRWTTQDANGRPTSIDDLLYDPPA